MKKLLVALLFTVLLASVVQAQIFPTESEGAEDGGVNGNALAIIGIAIAVVLAGIGSAIGITISASYGLGAMHDNPDLFPQVLLLSALPGTQGIYGFVVGFLILLWSGIFGGGEPLTVARGWWFLFAGMPIGFSGLISGIYQGKVCATGIGLTVKDKAHVAKGMTLAAFVEFYAILGLLASVLVLLNIR